MPSTTIYGSNCVCGTQNFGTNNALRAGKTGQSSSTGDYYRARTTFTALPQGVVITKLTLKLNRSDGNLTHTLNFGCSSSSAFAATLSANLNAKVSNGKNVKSIDLTSIAESIQAFTGTWYLHIRHGSGTNSYSEFVGDTSTNRPRLIVEYEDPTPVVDPKIVEMEFERCDTAGNPDDQGQRIHCKKLRISTASGQSSALTTYALTCTGSDNSTHTATLTSSQRSSALTASGYTETKPSLFTFTAGTGVSYTIQMTLGSAKEQVTATDSVPASFAKLHISGQSTGGVAVGMFSGATADHPRFEVADDHVSYFYGGISGVTNYQTGEVATGGKWIDGKPIYRYIITLGAIASGGKKSYELPSVVENIISFSGIRHLANGMISSLPYVSTSSFAYTAEFRVETDRKTLTVYIGSSTSMDHGYIILEYTKSATAADPTDPDSPEVI